VSPLLSPRNVTTCSSHCSLIVNVPQGVVCFFLRAIVVRRPADDNSPRPGRTLTTWLGPVECLWSRGKGKCLWACSPEVAGTGSSRAVDVEEAVIAQQVTARHLLVRPSTYALRNRTDVVRPSACTRLPRSTHTKPWNSITIAPTLELPMPSRARVDYPSCRYCLAVLLTTLQGTLTGNKVPITASMSLGAHPGSRTRSPWIDRISQSNELSRSIVLLRA